MKKKDIREGDIVVAMVAIFAVVMLVICSIN